MDSAVQLVWILLAFNRASDSGGTRVIGTASRGETRTVLVGVVNDASERTGKIDGVVRLTLIALSR